MKFVIETQTDTIDGSDGKKHMKIKDFKMELQPLGKLTYRFENLFNGDKQKCKKNNFTLVLHRLEQHQMSDIEKMLRLFVLYRMDVAYVYQIT